MPGRRPRFHQVPSPDDKEAWSAFVHWLRHYDIRGAGRSLELKTILGWRGVRETDWVLRFPGRELYVMPDERWQGARETTKPRPENSKLSGAEPDRKAVRARGGASE